MPCLLAARFMNALVCFILIWPGFAQEANAPAAPIRFRAVDVFVDSQAKALATYQVEVSVVSGEARLVGIEGGGHPAFQQPPFYDPKAIQQERVILAAFNTAGADKLPSGKTRVATLHFQTKGNRPPQYTVKLEAAATVDGGRMAVSVSLVERDGP